MDSAACTVTSRFGEIQGFHNDALAGKGRVTVDEDGQNLGAVRVTATLLPSAAGTFDDRVNDFEMRWVECQDNVDGATGRGDVR